MSDHAVEPHGVPSFYIELPDQEGVDPAAIGDDLRALKEQSTEAIGVAMEAVRSIADQISATLNAMEAEIRPNEMAVEFALKLDIEGGTVIPLIAKTTTGGQLKIKFKWT